jgi:flagellar biosynthesis protein FlhG
MPDQADGLRELLRVRPDPAPPSLAAPAAPARPHVLLFTGGKGGAGTSNLTLNLALALGRAGRSVVLIDADWGLANLDLLGGLTPAHDLGDVLAGACTLAEAVAPGPDGIRFLAGAHGLRSSEEELAAAPMRLAAGLPEVGAGAGFVLIDAGNGLGAGTGALAGVADEVVVVTTPEPAALADAHAVLARLRRERRTPGPGLRVAVNQARSGAEARAATARLTAAGREFFGLVVTGLGWVRADPRVPRAVRERRPFVAAFPRSAAARDVGRMARTLLAEHPRAAAAGRGPALTARMARWARQAACGWCA